MSGGVNVGRRSGVRPHADSQPFVGHSAERSLLTIARPLRAVAKRLHQRGDPLALLVVKARSATDGIACLQVIPSRLEHEAGIIHTQQTDESAAVHTAI
jgi:hypothetical protein